MSQPAPIPEIALMGVPITRLTQADTVRAIMERLAAGQGGWVMTPNLDILRRIVKDASYRQLAMQATIRTADGMPLLWAARLRGTPLPERVAGSDLIWSLTAAAAEQGRSIYFIGGAPGAAEACAARLKELHPSLKVAGIECPPVGFERDAIYTAQLDARLQAARPDIMYVALGAPKQDHLIARLRPMLPGTWFLGIGISFSFVAGDVKRAPRLLQRVGLEWVHRLFQEPRRLAKRYLVDGIPFALRLLVVSALQRGSR